MYMYLQKQDFFFSLHPLTSKVLSFLLFILQKQFIPFFWTSEYTVNCRTVGNENENSKTGEL